MGDNHIVEVFTKLTQCCPTRKYWKFSIVRKESGDLKVGESWREEGR
jgi:hypothetical protein